MITNTLINFKRIFNKGVLKRLHWEEEEKKVAGGEEEWGGKAEGFWKYF